jgi:hypothetical protein
MAPRVRGHCIIHRKLEFVGRQRSASRQFNNTVLVGIPPLLSNGRNLTYVSQCEGHAFESALPVTLHSIYHSYYRPQFPVVSRLQFVYHCVWNFRVRTFHRTSFVVYTGLNARCGFEVLGRYHSTVDCV